MKTRLPKMLLAAVLAAMTSAYALPEYVIINPDGTDQYYFGGDSTPIYIDNAANFGSGVSSAPASTVNIGYSDKTQAHDGYFALVGDTFDTPNALFIGGPGWDHKLSQGYFASDGALYLTNGATLNVATHVTMGSCLGASSLLYIAGGSTLNAVNMDVSSGGGFAHVQVGADDGITTGHINLSGNLTLGVNRVEGGQDGQFFVNRGSTVNVDGATSVGYGNEDYPAGHGELYVYAGGELTTDSLLAGVANEAFGIVGVSGTLNVTGSEHDILIGYDGGQGSLLVTGSGGFAKVMGSGGVANLGTANLWLGNSHYADDSTYGYLSVAGGGTLNLDGTIYVGGEGATIEGGGELHGTGSLQIGSASTVNADRVEVASGSVISVDGRLNVDETPDEYGIQGVRLYDGAILSGSPENGKGSLTFSVVPETVGVQHVHTNIVIEDFTLTEGTTLKAACDTHLKVGGESTLTFGDGTLWLTDGIAYIDAAGLQDVGTITTTAGTGNISVTGNDELNYFLNTMRSEKQEIYDKVALIDVGNFLENEGTVTSELLDIDGTLKLDRSGFEVRFAGEEGVTVLNGEYGVGGFHGFYVAKVEYPAEEAYPTFDRNQREVYDLIKQMEEQGLVPPGELQEVINNVLNMDGNTEAGLIRDALDFLGAVNYSVMMHNQIEGNLSHQRMLRNRSMVGRNLRHAKGCANLYASGFYDNQRLKGDRSKGEGYRRSEWGGLIGGDTCINEDWRIGADLALASSRISPSHNMKLKQRSFYWDIYAQFQKGNWRSHTSVGMGIHNFKVERGIGYLSARNNHVRGTSLNISEEVTYDWKIDEKSTVQPFVAVDLSWNRIKDFTDGDLGAMNIHVAKQSAFIAEFTLGGRYIRDFACVTDAPDATWYFQLGVAVDAGKTDSDMKCNFVGTPDQQFTIKAAKRDRVGLDLGTGLTMPVSAHWAIYGNAEIILRGDSHNFGAQLGAQYAF